MAYIAVVAYCTVRDIAMPWPLNSVVVAGLIVGTLAWLLGRATRRIDVVATARYRDGYADGYVDGVARATPRRSLHVVR